MEKHFCLKRMRLVITLSCIFILNLTFFNNSFVFAASEVNMSERLSQIPDELYRNLHNQKRFVNLTDMPENFKHLNHGIEESLQWKQVAAFSYALLDKVTIDRGSPFDLTEADKSQYGLVFTRDSDILIAFKAGDGKEKPDLWATLSSLVSVKLYDVYPQDSRMMYARHFFDIPDGYSYANRTLFSKLAALFSSEDWSMSFSAVEVNKSFLYAALSCQEEIFNLVGQYMRDTPYNQRCITFTGHLESAGASLISYVLLHQKFIEEGLIAKKDEASEEEDCEHIYVEPITIRSINFEEYPVFNSFGINIFNEKIPEERIKKILPAEHQKRIKDLVEALS